jgi:hypothetical protein
MLVEIRIQESQITEGSGSDRLDAKWQFHLSFLCRENMEEFSMSREEAVEEARDQFLQQGVNLRNGGAIFSTLILLPKLPTLSKSFRSVGRKTSAAEKKNIRHLSLRWDGSGSGPQG